MIYPYMYVVISFSDDLYNESYTTALFCDFKDAHVFYHNLKVSGKPCMLFKRNCSDNLNI